jgi:hypothetical protein
VTTFPTPFVHALLPLSVLEAVRVSDALPSDELGEYHVELATKRLGTSRTVEQQIARYRALAERGGVVPADEAVQLLALAGRRSDAAVVFADAGRRIALAAGAHVGVARRTLPRLVPGTLRRRLAFRTAQRLARRVLGVELSRDGGGFGARLLHDLPVRATPSGTACTLYGSAVAGLLREFTTFDGAMQHEWCRARGSDDCRWHSAPTPGGT